MINYLKKRIAQAQPINIPGAAPPSNHAYLSSSARSSDEKTPLNKNNRSNSTGDRPNNLPLDQNSTESTSTTKSGADSLDSVIVAGDLPQLVITDYNTFPTNSQSKLTPDQISDLRTFIGRGTTGITVIQSLRSAILTCSVRLDSQQESKDSKKLSLVGPANFSNLFKKDTPVDEKVKILNALNFVELPE